MKIKKISITNFRGIVDTLNLDFVGPDDKPLDIVVLAGPNGCGKTSVLEACIFALGYQSLLGQRGQPVFNIRSGCSDFEIMITAINKENEFTIKKTLKTHEVEGNEEYAKIFKTPMLGQKKREILSTIEYFASWRKPGILGPVSVNTSDKSAKDYGKDGEMRLKSIKTEIANLMAVKTIDEEASKQSDEFFNKLNKFWKYFHPNSNDKFEFNRIDKDISKGLNIFLKKPDLNEIYPVDSMSSGELDIFTLLASLAMNDYSKGIFFIDEPELHLHSAWHRIILRTLRELLPNTQIICATHSSEILDSVYSYERFTLLSSNDPRIRLTKQHAGGEQ